MSLFLNGGFGLNGMSGFHWPLHLMMPDKAPLSHLLLAPAVVSSFEKERARRSWQPIFRFMASCSLIAKIPLFTRISLVIKRQLLTLWNSG